MQVAAGALLLAVPSSAVALAATTPAHAGAAATSATSIRLGREHVGYGRTLAVTGVAGPDALGQPVELELDPAGAGSWQVIGRSVVDRDGDFRLTAPMHRSGRVRVLGAPNPAASVAASSTTTSPAAIAPSLARRVEVGAELSLPSRSRQVLTDKPVTIAGRLRPGIGGRRVALQSHGRTGWSVVATARTSGRGRFRLRYAPDGLGAHRLRVRFAGDRVNTGTSESAGRLTVFDQAVVSWYEDGGTTGCGFHAHFGVANKSLPCGTRVTFRNGSHTVTATVDDRGPYVGGRTYDLNQNTAAALDFAGVGSVWASV